MSKESHSFSVSVACALDMQRAIILQHLIFLQESSEDGWAKKSTKAMNATYPYLTPKQIRTAIEKMESAGLIISEIRNMDRSDRSKSFFVTTEGRRVYGKDPFAVSANAFVPKGKSDVAERANQMLPKGQMLIGSYTNSYTNVESEDAPAQTEFLPLNTHVVARNIPAPAAAEPAAGLPEISWGHYPKANTPAELRAELLKLYDCYPFELERLKAETPAKDMSRDQFKATMAAFCEYAISEGWERRPYQQINGKLFRWFKNEPLMQRKPAADPQKAVYTRPANAKSA